MKKQVPELFLGPDTASDLYFRALKVEKKPEDFDWPMVMYYRGAIDRKERNEKRTIGEFESRWRYAYDKGWDRMSSLLETEKNAN